jgi:glycosyltransferase involved in cell wall biosynthesis
MRVLAVANWDPAVTRIAWAEQRLEALRRHGLEVELVAEPCIGQPRNYLALWRAIDERLASGQYDLIAPLYGSALGLLCALQRRVPCALSFAGSDLNGSEERSLSVPVSQLAAALAAGVSVRTEAMRRALWWPATRHAARVIGSGVDVQRFRPIDRALARRRRGLPLDGPRVVLVTGSGERPGKRVDLARRAISQLPGVTLEVVARVPFEEMPLVYPSADALLLTSAKEGSPNCVKEALACAVPVISVDAGDVREVVAGLTNCAITDARPELLAAALWRAIADGRGCPEGPDRMAAHHSLEAMAGAFARFYRSIATTNSASRSVGSSSTWEGVAEETYSGTSSPSSSRTP